jgi:excisionase family DNA binding protein
MSEDRWLTVPQVAEILQVNEETVRRWIRKGELPVLSLGSDRAGYRVSRRMLDDFIAERVRPQGKRAA